MLREDLSSAYSLASSLNDLLDRFNVTRQQAILLLDFRKLDAASSADITATAAKVVNGVPGMEDWRAVIFAGSSMPQSLAERVKAENAINVGMVERVEHRIWLDLIQQRLKRRLAFGDYGVVHPDLIYMDPTTVNASAAIRYTVRDRWLIVRGRSLRQSPIGYKQFYSLSRTLAARKEFMGPSYSWGDGEIQKRARQQGKPGNLTTWVAVATNHHLTFVSQQVATAYDG
jgi:Beta protein